MTLELGRAEELIHGFERQRVLVVGDLMLDRYIYGRVRRISPEAPVPIVEATAEKGVPGGACNVAWNIRSLGARAGVTGIVGADREAEELKSLLDGVGVFTDGVMQMPDIRTTVKIRVMADRQQVVRLDWETPFAPSDRNMAKLCDLARSETMKSTGVIIEDYGKGVVRQPVVDAVANAANEAGIPVGYDPKEDHELSVQGITMATPNRKEAYIAAGKPEPSRLCSPLKDESLLEVGHILIRKWGVEFLAITLGPQGMLVFLDGEKPHHIPTRAKEVFDVSGAGDTVIAVSLLALTSGAAPVEAVELANHAAGIVVGKVGTAVCSREELTRSFS